MRNQPQFLVMQEADVRFLTLESRWVAMRSDIFIAESAAEWPDWELWSRRSNRRMKSDYRGRRLDHICVFSRGWAQSRRALYKCLKWALIWSFLCQEFRMSAWWHSLGPTWEWFRRGRVRGLPFMERGSWLLEEILLLKAMIRERVLILRGIRIHLAVRSQIREMSLGFGPKLRRHLDWGLCSLFFSL